MYHSWKRLKIIGRKHGSGFHDAVAWRLIEGFALLPVCTLFLRADGLGHPSAGKTSRQMGISKPSDNELITWQKTNMKIQTLVKITLRNESNEN